MTYFSQGKNEMGSKNRETIKDGSKFSLKYLYFCVIIFALFFVLLLAACNNPFMEQILGRKIREEAHYTGRPGTGTLEDPFRV